MNPCLRPGFTACRGLRPLDPLCRPCRASKLEVNLYIGLPVHTNIYVILTYPVPTFPCQLSMPTCPMITYLMHILCPSISCQHIPSKSCAHITHAHISYFSPTYSHALHILRLHMPSMHSSLSAYVSSLGVFVFQPSYFHFNSYFTLICLCTFRGNE